MKYSEFYKLIESAGWTIKKGKKHYKYVHPDFDYFIPVGRHQSQEIPNGTLDSMLKNAPTSVGALIDEFKIHDYEED